MGQVAGKNGLVFMISVVLKFKCSIKCPLVVVPLTHQSFESSRHKNEDQSEKNLSNPYHGFGIGSGTVRPMRRPE